MAKEAKKPDLKVAGTDSKDVPPGLQSPEGRERASRLYFSLIVILFIFLGTIVMMYQFGNNITKEIVITKIISIFPGKDTAAAPEQTETQAPPAPDAQTAAPESAPAATEGQTPEAPAPETATEAPADAAPPVDAAPPANSEGQQAPPASDLPQPE